MVSDLDEPKYAFRTFLTTSDVVPACSRIVSKSTSYTERVSLSVSASIRASMDSEGRKWLEWGSCKGEYEHRDSKEVENLSGVTNGADIVKRLDSSKPSSCKEHH